MIHVSDSGHQTHAHQIEGDKVIFPIYVYRRYGHIIFILDTLFEYGLNLAKCLSQVKILIVGYVKVVTGYGINA